MVFCALIHSVWESLGVLSGSAAWSLRGRRRRKTPPPLLKRSSHFPSLKSSPKMCVICKGYVTPNTDKSHNMGRGGVQFLVWKGMNHLYVHYFNSTTSMRYSDNNFLTITAVGLTVVVV